MWKPNKKRTRFVPGSMGGWYYLGESADKMLLDRHQDHLAIAARLDAPCLAGRHSHAAVDVRALSELARIDKLLLALAGRLLERGEPATGPADVLDHIKQGDRVALLRA